MRTILISGASRGIGLNIAYKQLKEGNRISVGIRDITSLKGSIIDPNKWSKEVIRKKALYHFGLEKLMRFDEKLLREFFGSFFQLPKNQWYGFLTDTLSLKEIVYAMCVMFIKAPWSVKKGLMIMHGREFKMLLRIIFPNI